MEKTFPKKPSVYVFGAVVIAVLAVLVFPQLPLVRNVAHGATSDEQLRQINNPTECAQQGGVWDDNAGCQPIPETPVGKVDLSKVKNLGPTVGAVEGFAVDTTGASEEGLDFQCGLWDFFSNFGLCTIWGLGWVVNLILSWLVVLSSQLLDYGIRFNFAITQYVGATQGIGIVWGTIRDLANIIFIFFLLWFSIETILGLGEGIKKVLPNVIIAALLINFSMFFTKVIIDASNIVAYQFYTGITANGQETVGTSLLRGLKVQGIYNSDYTSGGLASTQAKPPQTKTGLLVTIIGGSVLLTIALYAFINVAFIMLARVLMLILLLATSPIAFIAAILPKKMKTYHDLWWDNIWDQALVAPIFMLMMWVTTTVAYTFSQSALGGKSSMTLWDALSPGKAGAADVMGPIFNFLLLIGLMIATVKITKQLSGAAGAMITKLGGTAMGAVMGGAGGALFRNTLGRAASRLSQTEWMRDWDARNKFFIGKGLLRATEGISKASGDVRAGVPLVGGIAGKIAGAAGVSVDFGKSSGEGGYQARLDKQVEAREKYIASREPNKVELAKKDQEIYLKKQSLAAHVAGGRSEDDATGRAIKADIARLGTERREILTRRKEQAATETERHKADTIWMKMARKDKLGAAKFRIEEKKKYVETLEKEIAEHKNDIRGLEGIQIRTPEQDTRLQEAREKKVQKEADIAKARQEISQLESDRR